MKFDIRQDLFRDHLPSHDELKQAWMETWAAILLCGRRPADKCSPSEVAPQTMEQSMRAFGDPDGRVVAAVLAVYAADPEFGRNLEDRLHNIFCHMHREHYDALCNEFFERFGPGHSRQGAPPAMTPPPGSPPPVTPHTQDRSAG